MTETGDPFHLHHFVKDKQGTTLLLSLVTTILFWIVHDDDHVSRKRTMRIIYSLLPFCVLGIAASSSSSNRPFSKVSLRLVKTNARAKTKPSPAMMNYNSVTFSADLSLEPIMDANGPLSLYRRELENNRGNHDNIDLRSSPTTGTNHQGQIPPMNELALFFRTLEWMEIEGAILQSYKELVTPLVVAVRRQRDGQRFLFRRQDLQTIDKVLTEVDTIVAQVMRRTFSEFHFACGVLNSILVTVVFLCLSTTLLASLLGRRLVFATLQFVQTHSCQAFEPRLYLFGLLLDGQYSGTRFMDWISIGHSHFTRYASMEGCGTIRDEQVRCVRCLCHAKFHWIDPSIHNFYDGFTMDLVLN